MAKKKKQKSVIGLVVVAALLGAALGVSIFNASGEAPPTPPLVDKGDGYDDDWGKLDRPVAKATVKHILISWKGKNARVTPKDPNRTQEQAKALVEELWQRYKTDPTDENWKALQAEYNEDSAPHNDYVCEEGASLDQAFNEVGRTTRLNHARITNFDSGGGSFGYHLIRREK